MSRALTTLARLRRYEAEALSRELADLSAATAAWREESETLGERMNERADIEHARFTADYVRALSETLRAREARMRDLETETAGIRRDLGDTFAALKRIETVAERRREADVKERSEREARAAEEAFRALTYLRGT